MIPQSTYAIIKLFQFCNGQEPIHVHAVRKEKSNEIHPVVNERIHHGLIQRSGRPIVSAFLEYFTGHIFSIPRQEQVQLVDRTHILSFEQSVQHREIQFVFMSAHNSRLQIVFARRIRSATGWPVRGQMVPRIGARLMRPMLLNSVHAIVDRLFTGMLSRCCRSISVAIDSDQLSPSYG